MDYQEEKEIEVFNEFDYSNIVADVTAISYLVQYCETIYNQMLQLMIDDEENNKKLKIEFRNHQYKKTFETKLEISVADKGHSFSNHTFKSYESFIEASNNGYFKNIAKLTIELNLTYNKGKTDSLKEYKNSFKIVFKPYDIIFTRMSNHNEQYMNKIEEHINTLLGKFPVQNSIFCTK